MIFDASFLSRWLRRLTLIYLGVPVAIFFGGWLRLPLALMMIGVLGWACWRSGWPGGRMWLMESGARSQRSLRLSPAACVFGGLLPAMAFVFLSGAGGWGAGDSDWFKHDTILRDLVERPWPVVYGTSTGPALLVYYVAFYLPAALVGKWTGSWMLASHTLALTMLAGILLSLGWLALLGTFGSDKASGSTVNQPGTGWWWRGAAVFFCFSGMDVVGKMGVNLYLHLPLFYGDWNDVEWWAQAFQYPSNAAALFWAPHQAVGAWLPCALLLDSARNTGLPVHGSPANAEDEDIETPDAFPLALAWMWSPFAAIGLVPVFAGLFLFGTKGDMGVLVQRVSRAIRAPINPAAASVVIVATAFYAARMVPFALPAVAMVTPGRSPAPLIEQGLVPWPLLYAAFVLLEFGFVALALWWIFSGRNSALNPVSEETANGSQHETKLLLGLATGILLLLPLIHYGYANDLVMRGSLPALFILQVLLLCALSHAWNTGQRFAFLAVVLLLAAGAANAFLEYRRHVDRMIRDASWRDVARDDFASRRTGKPLPIQSLFELQRGIYNRPGFDFARQYLGSTRSFYNLHLAPPEPLPPQPMHE